MRVYATVEDLQQWVTDTPPNAGRLLQQASAMVEAATRWARYRVDEHGYPTHPSIADVFTYAVCAQVSFWIEADLDPIRGASGQKAKVSSQSVPGGSVSYQGVQSTQELGAAATTLCEAAWLALVNAGLITNEVVYIR